MLPRRDGDRSGRQPARRARRQTGRAALCARRRNPGPACARAAPGDDELPAGVRPLSVADCHPDLRQGPTTSSPRRPARSASGSSLVGANERRSTRRPLVAPTATGPVVQYGPGAYQPVDGDRRTVDANFVLTESGSGKFPRPFRRAKFGRGTLACVRALRRRNRCCLQRNVSKWVATECAGDREL